MDSQLIVLLIVTISRSSGQSTLTSTYSSIYKDCCELKLMDSNLQVAIEANRSFPAGNYSLIKARFCTTDTIFIQLWKKVNESVYDLKWQTQFNASVADTEKAYITLRFDNNPVSIAAEDRLGLYNPSDSNLKFSVPYEFDQGESNSMIFSKQRYGDSSVFMKGLLIETDDLRWPRSFAPYLMFCSSASDCAELAFDYSALQPETSTYKPPGGFIPAYCCNKMLSCDIGESLKDNITNQNNEMNSLKNTVDVLRNTLQNLLNSQYITGICPSGFAPGTYGVGSCYIIHREQLQMGQAVIRCRDSDAKLLSIQSALEDSFIKKLVLNSSSADTEQFWTAVMYNTELRNWFSYDADLATKMPLGSFRNWKDGQELAATSIYDVCSVFTVNKINETDYWEKATCTDLNFFICEFPKMCL